MNTSYLPEVDLILQVTAPLPAFFALTVMQYSSPLDSDFWMPSVILHSSAYKQQHLHITTLRFRCSFIFCILNSTDIKWLETKSQCLKYITTNKMIIILFFCVTEWNMWGKERLCASARVQTDPSTVLTEQKTSSNIIVIQRLLVLTQPLPQNLYLFW